MDRAIWDACAPYRAIFVQLTISPDLFSLLTDSTREDRHWTRIKPQTKLKQKEEHKGGEKIPDKLSGICRCYHDHKPTQAI